MKRPKLAGYYSGYFKPLQPAASSFNINAAPSQTDRAARYQNRNLPLKSEVKCEPKAVEVKKCETSPTKVKACTQKTKLEAVISTVPLVQLYIKDQQMQLLNENPHVLPAVVQKKLSAKFN
jgi:hypothetical protein